MTKTNVRKLATYILDELYLSNRISFNELLQQIYLDKPPVNFNCKNDDWEELDDINSDAIDSLSKKLIDIQKGKVNSVKHNFSIVEEIIPSNLSKSLFNNEVPKFLKNITDTLKPLSNIEKGYEFERICVAILREKWSDIHELGQSGDKGIDILCYEKLSFPNECTVSIAIQCKYYCNNIDAPIIRKFLGDLLIQTIDESQLKWPILPILITDTGFSEEAQRMANKYGIKLLTLKSLIEEVLNKSTIEFDTIIKNIHNKPINLTG